MCTGMEIAALAAMAGGTYLQNEAQNDAADAQQKAIEAANAQQDDWSRKAEAKAMENAQEYDPTKRLQRFDEARTEAGKSLVSLLDNSRNSMPSTGQSAGRMSADFLTGDAQSKADTYQASTDMARLMGKMRGAQDMLTNEGYTNANYASDLGRIGSKAAGDMRASSVGINAAGIPDQGQMMLGGLASGIGSGMLMSSASAAGGNGGGGWFSKLTSQAPAPVRDGVVKLI